MKRVKKKRIRIVRILIIFLLLAIGFKTYDFFVPKYEYENNNLNEVPVSSEIKEDFNGLILINKNNKLPNDYTVDLINFQNYMVANILIDDLREMYNDAKKNNINLEITSAYRTKSEQQQIFDSKVAEFAKSGNSYNLAVSMTEKTVAQPGYSEHETGLAIDFSNTSNYNKRIELWNWLELNAYKYGFILRYPMGKEYITGIDYEAWHYRYVGRKDAIIIYESGKTLEEYLNPNEYINKRGELTR